MVLPTGFSLIRFLVPIIFNEPRNPNDELSRLPPALDAGVVDVGWAGPGRAFSYQRDEFKGWW
ncbi:hypothetical protein [Aureliella helgolandensis]|uniref:hypothetical protein n=1 Tax=Aureliella helgolandensis TaxID=2527968 RepID=UPI001E4119E4|nr:hypothetical protein [Aureliella helgolandensis]